MPDINDSQAAWDRWSETAEPRCFYCGLRCGGRCADIIADEGGAGHRRGAEDAAKAASSAAFPIPLYLRARAVRQWGRLCKVVALAAAACILAVLWMWGIELIP